VYFRKLHVLDVRFVSIVSRLGPDTLYLIVSRARFIDFRKLCISLYPDLLQIHCISVYPHVPAIVFNIQARRPGVPIPPALWCLHSPSKLFCPSDFTSHECHSDLYVHILHAKKPGVVGSRGLARGWFVDIDDYFCAPRPRPLGCSFLTGLDRV